MDVRSQLLVEIERYLENRRIAETTFGRLAVNDGKFVGRLRANKNVTVGTVERVQQFLRNGADTASTTVNKCRCDD